MKKLQKKKGGEMGCKKKRKQVEWIKNIKKKTNKRSGGQRCIRPRGDATRDT